MKDQSTKKKLPAVVLGSALGVLATDDLALLETAEATISRGLKDFYAVGEALATVRDRKLYRGNYNSFEEYLKRKWDVSRAEGNRLVDAASVKKNLSPIGDSLPRKESHVLPLIRLTAEEQRAVWQKIMKAAQTTITAKLIAKVVAEEFPVVDDGAIARLEAAKALPPVADFCSGLMITARAQLEPKCIKLLIMNMDAGDADIATTLNVLGRHIADDCIVAAICGFHDEKNVGNDVAAAGYEVRDRSIYYADISTKPRSTGTIARHRSILLANRRERNVVRNGMCRLPDPLVFPPDKDFLDAFPVALYGALIEAFTVPGETIVIPADRYAAGVIAGRKAMRSVLGVERDETLFLRGRDRLDREFDAPKRLDKRIEESLVNPVTNSGGTK